MSLHKPKRNDLSGSCLIFRKTAFVAKKIQTEHQVGKDKFRQNLASPETSHGTKLGNWSQQWQDCIYRATGLP